jgi:putative membrane protein
MKLIAKWLLGGCTLLLLAQCLPGITVTSFGDAFAAAVLIAFLNTFFRPVLVLLTLPVTVLSVGLFLFVINAVLFWAAGRFLEGFEVATFGTALLGSLIYSVAMLVVEAALRQVFQRHPA